MKTGGKEQTSEHSYTNNRSYFIKRIKKSHSKETETDKSRQIITQISKGGVSEISQNTNGREQYLGKKQCFN